MLESYSAMLGAFNLTEYTDNWALLFFVLFLFLVLVVMLNLLIAIMSDSFANVQQDVEVVVRRLRVQTILDEEALMSPTARLDATNFPKYL